MQNKGDMMKLRVLLGLFLVLVLFAGQGFAQPPAAFSEQHVPGRPPKGNHSLDCTVFRPWDSSSGPGDSEYPVIVWANGWGGNDVEGETTTEDWYRPMLIDWALDGPYIVIAANQWSVQESDVLACLQWIVDQDKEVDSEYEGVINTAKIGLAGHSQGGGAVVKAGDGDPNGFEITTVIAMNPYGPSWVDAAKQDGPVMILTGSEDLTTPRSWTYPVFEAIQENGQGGLYAVLEGAGHSDLDRYQEVVLLWWQFTLNDRSGAGRRVKRILDNDPWDTDYATPWAIGF
jgi:acetyl esterase/lipase